MNTLQNITLTGDARIAGQFVEKGTVVASTPEVVEAGYRAIKRESARRALRASVGDTDSILGTTSDGLHWLLVEFLGFAKTVSTAKDLEEVKAAAKTIADKASPILGETASKRLKLPYQHKKGTDVLKEVATLATKTTAALEGKTVETSEPVSPVDSAAADTPAAPYKTEEQRLEEFRKQQQGK